MKHPLIALIAMCFAIMQTSCIDEQYDLSKIDSDDITIGGDESEFKMPLASVKITIDDICQSANMGEISIKELYETMSVWFPESMPDGSTSIDVQRLMNDDAYFQLIFDDLYNELQENDEKRMAVCMYVVKNYRSDFIESLLASSNPEIVLLAKTLNTLSNEAAAEALSLAVKLYPDEIKASVQELSETDMPYLALKDINIDIPPLNISNGVLDLLTANLDSATEKNPVNALYLYGRVESNFPFKFNLSPVLDDALINFGELVIDLGDSNINDIRIYKEDLETIIHGSYLRAPVEVDQYYLYEEFNEDCEMTIYLSLRKTGGLSGFFRI